MRTVDSKCEVHVREDGKYDLEISARGLTLAEANLVADSIRDPFREVLLKILTNDGETARRVERLK